MGDTMNMDVRKAHDDKERKMAKLQQLAFMTNASANASSDIQEANKRKMEATRKSNDMRKMIEELQDTIKELVARVEANEGKHKEALQCRVRPEAIRRPER